MESSHQSRHSLERGGLKAGEEEDQMCILRKVSLAASEKSK